jgi:hypothetical protein
VFIRSINDRANKLEGVAQRTEEDEEEAALRQLQAELAM